MRAFFIAALSLATLFTSPSTVNADCINLHHNGSLVSTTGPNSCVTFQVGAGTGCAWMCSYCASQLGTNNYYFTTGICKYQTGGCVGNPQPSTSYTCCATA